MLYKIYVTDILRASCNALYGKEAVKRRYIDIITQKEKPEIEDNRTADEILRDLTDRMGIEVTA